MLGNLLHEKPDELRADMQQVYGLCIDEWEKKPIHFATCAAQLGADARVNGSISVESLLLSAIEFNTHVSYWLKTKDAQKRRNVPKPISLKPEAASTSMTVEQFEKFRESKMR